MVELEGNDVDAVPQGFAKHAKHHDEALQSMGYFKNNRKRNRYAQIRQAGLCVSSGVLDVDCKNATGSRLKCGVCIGVCPALMRLSLCNVVC